MRRISLRYRNGTPFISSYSASAVTVRDYSETINFEKNKCLDDTVTLFHRLDDAVTLFHQMIRMKPLPALSAFTKLFQNMLKMDQCPEVVSLFREMQKLGIPINVFILNIVINTNCLMGHSGCAFSVLPIYLKNGISFDVVTFNTLLRGIFAEDKVKDAILLFQKLVRDIICAPDEVMFGIVRNELSKKGFTDKNLSLLRLMERWSIKPDISIYIIVIDSLCKDRKFNAAINIFNEMKQKGIPPNEVIYCSLIDSLYEFGQWVKVKTLLSEMMANYDFYPDVPFFNILINGLCKEGKVEDAQEVMRLMVEKGIEPDFITYNVLLNGYHEKKKVDEAMQLFCEISQKGSKPNIVNYTTILQGLFDAGRIGDAEEFFGEMLSAGSIPDLCTYTTLFSSYFKYGLVEEALLLFNKLEEKRENIDIDFTILSLMDCAEMMNSTKLVPFLRSFLSLD